MDENVTRLASVLDPDRIPEYERMCEDVCKQMLVVQHYLFYIDKIASFPYRLFMPEPEGHEFWKLTANALMELSIIILWRVVVDENKGALQQLQATVFGQMKKNAPEVAKELGEHIREIGRRVKAKTPHWREIRDTFLGHLLLEEAANLTPQVKRITREDVRAVLEDAWAIFDILCFETKSHRWYWAYNERQQSGSPTDIDWILDAVAKNSPFLHVPENNPRWDSSDISDDDRTILNLYRRKFGLSEV